MVRESSRVEELRQALGKRLATFRRSVGMSQEQLGQRVYCNRSLIAHIEAGNRNKDRDFWRAVDNICQADGALLAAFAELESARASEMKLQRDRDLAAAQEKASRIRHANMSVADSHNRLDFGTQSGARSLTNNCTHPSVEAAVTASQMEWRKTRRYLVQHRTELSRGAVGLYESGLQVRGTPTFARPDWLPQEPIPLADLELDWDPCVPQPTLTGREAAPYSLLPLRTPRDVFPSYTSAMRYIDSPRLFENRPSYRLMEVSGSSFRFGFSTYFDKLDISEALGHEYALSTMHGDCSWPRLPFRALMADPFDLSLRAATTGISTLTIRRNTRDGTATFFLMERDHSNVAMGASQYGVVPAGEFQPANVGSISIQTDLNVWRNVVREYSEELLGEPEHDGSSGRPIDYDCWPFYRAMERARASEELQIFYLGTVIHALGLNVSIMTVAIIDDVAFDHLFRDMVHHHAEGANIVASTKRESSLSGLPFNEDVVKHFLRYQPMTGSSSACLATTWAWREILGLAAK